MNRASDASDHLRDGLMLGMAVTALFAPTPGADRQFPTRRLAANALAIGSSEGTVRGLKALVGRERPDESNDKSFPSGHTVKAVASTSLIRRNLAPSIKSPKLRAGFDAAMVSASTLVGWARMEADKHFPSDVLTSAALGNAFAQFFYRALVDDDDAPAVQVTAGSDGLTLTFVKAF